MRIMLNYPFEQNEQRRSLMSLVATGERRIKYLQRCISERNRSQSAIEYDKEEIEFLIVAINALRYQYATMAPETSPAFLLREIIDELDEINMIGQSEKYDRLAMLVARGRRILAEL